MAQDTYIGNKTLAKLVEEKQPGDRVISFSQYGKYFTCPKSWEINYIQKVKEADESIHLVFGQAIHSVMQDWLKMIYTESVRKANEMDLHKMLLAAMTKEYAERKEKFGKHFSTPTELASFYNDGCAILDYLRKRRGSYFTTRKVKLIAIEFPVMAQVHEDYPTIKLTGFIDLIFYDEDLLKYTIIDIKTSTRGWNDYKKKDENTTDQVLIYKGHFAKLLKVDISAIDVKYFIVKRKIDPDSLWVQKRIQEFSPSSGKVSLSRVSKNLRKFVEQCFNYDGTYKTDKVYPAIAGKNFKNCLFCKYDTREDVCPRSNRICDE